MRDGYKTLKLAEVANCVLSGDKQDQVSKKIVICNEKWISYDNRKTAGKLPGKEERGKHVTDEQMALSEKDNSCVCDAREQGPSFQLLEIQSNT